MYSVLTVSGHVTSPDINGFYNHGNQSTGTIQHPGKTAFNPNPGPSRQ